MFEELCGKIVHSFPRNERIHYFRKKPLISNKGQHFFSFQLAGGAPISLFRATGVSCTNHFFGFQLARVVPLLAAGGEPSTRFPPEGFVELPTFLCSMTDENLFGK